MVPRPDAKDAGDGFHDQRTADLPAGSRWAPAALRILAGQADTGVEIDFVPLAIG